MTTKGSGPGEPSSKINSNKSLPLLGLFPALSIVGGVQSAAKEAIAALRDSPRWSLTTLAYDKNLAASRNLPDLTAPTRIGTGLAAVRHRAPWPVIIVWHLDMLKLVPLVSARKSRLAVIILGVEAWKRRPFIDRVLLKKADLFVSISDHSWRQFSTANPQAATTEHLTVHLGSGSPLDGHPNAPDALPTALMVGRLDKHEDYKGHREILTAWPTVLRNIPTAILRIVGSGDLLRDLERVAVGLGIADSVVFHGYLPENEKHDLLERSRCLAMPSRGEGFGLVYLEAMRLGRPCLVSNSDAGREVVNPPEAGLAVDPGDTDAISATLCRLLTQGTDWDRWSAQAKARYENNFTSRHYRRRLLEALEHLRQY